MTTGESRPAPGVVCSGEPTAGGNDTRIRPAGEAILDRPERVPPVVPVTASRHAMPRGGDREKSDKPRRMAAIDRLPCGQSVMSIDE